MLCPTPRRQRSEGIFGAFRFDPQATKSFLTIFLRPVDAHSEILPRNESPTPGRLRDALNHPRMIEVWRGSNF
jgi:hypothetical protein